MTKIKRAFTLIELVVALALAAVLMAGTAVFTVYVTRMQGYIQSQDKDLSNANQFRMLIENEIEKRQDLDLTFYNRTDTAANIKTSGYNTKIFSFDSGNQYYYYDASKSAYGYYDGTTATDKYTTDMAYLMTISQVSTYQAVQISLLNPNTSVSVLTFQMAVSHLTIS